MKHLPPISVLTVLFVAGCNADPSTNTHDHWNLRGVGPSFTRAALGFDAEKDGKYIDYQYQKKKSIYLTLKRHMLNENPENPFQAEDEAFYAPRPPHSILPRPWEYINFEGAAWGGIIAAAGSGVFTPIPIDSVIGTMSEGGADEFNEGIRRTFSGETTQTTSASFLHEAIGLQVASAPVD